MSLYVRVCIIVVLMQLHEILSPRGKWSQDQSEEYWSLAKHAGDVGSSFLPSSKIQKLNTKFFRQITALAHSIILKLWTENGFGAKLSTLLTLMKFTQWQLCIFHLIYPMEAWPQFCSRFQHAVVFFFPLCCTACCVYSCFNLSRRHSRGNHSMISFLVFICCYSPHVVGYQVLSSRSLQCFWIRRWLASLFLSFSWCSRSPPPAWTILISRTLCFTLPLLQNKPCTCGQFIFKYLLLGIHSFR